MSGYVSAYLRMLTQPGFWKNSVFVKLVTFCILESKDCWKKKMTDFNKTCKVKVMIP